MTTITNATDSHVNLFFEIARRARLGYTFSYEESSLINTALRAIAVDTDQDVWDVRRRFLDLMEKRTGDTWFFCTGYNTPWPIYQRADDVYYEDDDYCEGYANSEMVWAEDSNGDNVRIHLHDTYTTAGGTRITEDYYSSSHFTCDGCEQIFHDEDHASNGYCYSCAEREDDDDDNYDNGNIIKGYSDRIERFLRPDYHPTTRYFGLEVEQEFPGENPHERARWAMDNISGLDNLCIWKSDGSLSNGAELVTLGKTLDYWSKPNPLQALCNNKPWRAKARAHKTTTCGLHIHVSRSTIPEPTIAKLVVLMNDPSMAEFVSLVARRSTTSNYCQASKKAWHSDRNYEQTRTKEPVWDDVQNTYLVKGKPITQLTRPATHICKKQSTQGGRYTPVNLTEHTVEFRMFKGTLRWETILASIEFCDAAIAYVTQAGCSQLTADHFTKWIKKHVTRKTYPALRAYLQYRDWLPTRPTADNVTPSDIVVEEETPVVEIIGDEEIQRQGWGNNDGNTPFTNIPGDHYVTYSNLPMPVRASFSTPRNQWHWVMPGETWWSADRTCSFRVIAA